MDWIDGRQSWYYSARKENNTFCVIGMGKRQSSCIYETSSNDIY